MWRSIHSRSSSLTRNLLTARKLTSLQTNSSLSQQQVFQHITSSSKSCLFLVDPTYKSCRLFSQSVSSEFDSENNHDPSSSSSEEENSTTHDLVSSQAADFIPHFDKNDVIRDAQMSSFGSSDDLAADFDEIAENNVAQMSSLVSGDGMSADFDENAENNGAQMSGFGSADGKSADFDGNAESNGAQMSSLGSVDELCAEFDGNGEISDAQMSGLGSNDEEGEKVEVFDVEKLEKVVTLLQNDVDGSLESSLDGLDLGLNEEFVVRVIETKLVPRSHLIRFYKWASSKEGVTVGTTAVVGSLVCVVCNEPRKKEAYAVWDLVKEICERESGVVNVEMLNDLISAFSRLGKGKAAFEVFGKFEEFGCVANADTYYLTMEALCKRSFYDWAVVVCQKMLEAGVLPESKKVGEIISFLCKGLKSEEAHAVYLAAKKSSKYPPQRAVNFLVSCLSKVDETVHLGQEMLVEFSGDVRKHAINPFSWVVRGLCRKKDIEGAKKLLSEMIEKGPPPGNAVFNMLVNALSKNGDLEDAKVMLKLMESRGLKPDVFSYSVIISGYVKGGAMEEACKVLSEARKKHPKLCPATFHTLIRGYCKLGQFDKAVKLLSDMKDCGVEPNVDEYNKLIQSLCLNALDWETAEKLLEEMKNKGLYLPGISRGLINAVKELEQEALGSEEAVAKA